MALLTMCLDMAMEVTQLSKRLSTLRAPVGFFSSVSPDVGAQVILLWKGFWAKSTGKWALTYKIEKK